MWVSKKVLGLPKFTWRLVQEKDYSLMAGGMASSIRLLRGAGEVWRCLAELFPWHWPELEDNVVHYSLSVPWNVMWKVSFFPGGLLQTFEMPAWVLSVQGGKVEFCTPQTYWKVIIFGVECTLEAWADTWAKLIQDQKHQTKSFLCSCSSQGNPDIDTGVLLFQQPNGGHYLGEHSHLEEPDGVL